MKKDKKYIVPALEVLKVDDLNLCQMSVGSYTPEEEVVYDDDSD